MSQQNEDDEEEESYPLVFIPEDPSEISMDSSQQMSPLVAKPIAKSMLGQFHASASSLFFMSDELWDDEPDPPLPWEQTEPKSLVPDDQQLKSSSKSRPSNVRRSKSVGVCQEETSTKKIGKSLAKPIQLSERQKSAPSSTKERRASRHRSISHIDHKLAGLSDAKPRKTGGEEPTPGGRRRSSIERAKSIKESRVSKAKAEPTSPVLPSKADGEATKPQKMTRKASRRRIKTGSDTAGHIVSPNKASRMKEASNDEEKVRRKSSRNLRDLTTDTASRARDGLVPGDSENRKVYTESDPKGESEIVKPLSRKLSRRVLKDEPDSGNNIDLVPPLSNEEDPQVGNKSKRFDKAGLFKRSMSDFGISKFVDAKIVDTAQEGSTLPRRNTLQRLQSMTKVINNRTNTKKPKPRIDATVMSPFELHLTRDLWSDDAVTVAMALGKLGSLLVTEKESSLSTLDQVGSSSIVGCLRKWWHDVDVQTQGLRLLSLLATNISDQFLEGAVRCGAFEIIITSMENNPSDQLLQQFACGAIYALINTESSDPATRFITDLGALSILLRPILAFPSNDEIQKNVKLAFNSAKRFDELHDSLELGNPIMRHHSRRSTHRRTQTDIPRPPVCNISDGNDTGAAIEVT